MARFRLRCGHYLNIIDNYSNEQVEWIHEETDRTTGRTNRKKYHVPMLLDAETIVTTEADKAFPKDTVFFGEPTPDMEPLDEEAEALVESLKSKWKHPIDTLPANGGMNEQEKAFMTTMMESFAKQVGAALPAQPVAATGVSLEEFEMMKKQLADLQALLMADKSNPAAAGRRL